MAISFVSAGAESNLTAAGTLSPGLPSGYQAGDILIIITVTESGTPLGNPSGYTDIFGNNNGTAVAMRVSQKTASSSETAPTFSVSVASRAVMLCYRASSGLGITVEDFGENTKAGTILEGQEVTTTQINNYLIFTSGTASTAATLTGNAGYTTRFTGTPTAAAMGILATDFDLTTTLGLYTPPNASSSVSIASLNFSIVLRETSTKYWVGGTGSWTDSLRTNWSLTSGGTGSQSVPFSQDPVIIDANSGTGTITCTAGVCNNLTVTASQAITLGAGSSTLSIYGNLSLPSGGSFAVFNGGMTITFAATTTGKTITSNGKSMLCNITFDGVGGGWALQDDLTYGSVRALTLTRGSFNANNFNVTGGTVASSNSNTRALTMGSGTWTLSGTGTVWNFASVSGLAFNTGTSTIALSDTSTNTKTFAGGPNSNYYNLSISATTGVASYIFTGANTFNQISSSKTVAYTITLPSSTTTTVTTWSATGSLGNLLTLNSSTAGTAATLAATNTFTVNYGLIQDVNMSTTLKGTATNSNVITSNNWQIATTSNRWLTPLITAGTNSITTPSDWPTTAISNIHVIGGGGGGAGNVTSTIAGGAGGGGGGYALLANTTLAASTVYYYTVGAGGTGSAGGATNQTGNTGGTSGWNGTQNTISFVSSAVSVQNTSSTTITVTVPSVVNGDLMLMMVTAGNTTANTWTTPSGWTEGTAGVQSRALFWRIASSEPANYTVTQSGSTTSDAIIVAYRNAVFNTSGLASQSQVTSPIPVTITVAVPNSTIVYVAQSNPGASITYTTPTGYTARASDSDATAPSAAIFSLAGVGSGSYSAPGITGSGSSSRAYVIALSPSLSSFTASATGGAGGASTTTPTSTGGAGGTGSTINYIASAQTQTVSSSTTLTINVPTGTANGDLMVAMVLTSASTSATWTTPAGWTAAVTSSSARGVYYRTASSEPASYTFTASGSGTSQGYIFTYRNAQFDVSSAITTNSNPTVTASITTTANNAILLYYAGISTNASETYTAPTGFSTLATDSDATAPSSAVFYKLQTAAGATGTVSCTGSTTNNRAVILAIKPILNGNGGTGGAGAISGTSNRAGGGGGGAAGPNGNGGNGGAGFGGTGAGGGGGGGNGGGTAGAAGTASTAGAGGNNSLGTGGGGTNTAGTLGGGGGGGRDGGTAGSGGAGIDIIVGLYGGGGGAGGSSQDLIGRPGGLYGGGGSGAAATGATARAGGAGAQGAIFINHTGTYVASTGTGNFFFLFM
jgi:hypothetical protein